MTYTFLCLWKWEKKGLDQDPDWSEVLVPQFHIELSAAVRFAELESSSGIKSTSLTVITSLT